MRVMPSVTVRVLVKWPWLENAWLRWKFRDTARERRRREAEPRPARRCSWPELEARMLRAL
jgi:hypothetical protein